MKKIKKSLNLDELSIHYKFLKEKIENQLFFIDLFKNNDDEDNFSEGIGSSMYIVSTAELIKFLKDALDTLKLISHRLLIK